jgi:hypothetical protein
MLYLSTRRPRTIKSPGHITPRFLPPRMNSAYWVESRGKKYWVFCIIRKPKMCPCKQTLRCALSKHCLLLVDCRSSTMACVVVQSWLGFVLSWSAMTTRSMAITGCSLKHLFSSCRLYNAAHLLVVAWASQPNWAETQWRLCESGACFAICRTMWMRMRRVWHLRSGTQQRF